MSPIHLFVPSFRIEECLAEIRACLEKGWTGLGYKTVDFERAWSAFSRLPHAHFLNSATAGLHLAFRLLREADGWRDGDEVITTPLTFVSTNHAILYERLRPVFADVDEFLCLDPGSIRERIGPRTRAVCFVGLGGNAGRYPDVLRLCRDNGLRLVLDAAHMAATRLEGRQGGCDAHVPVFSFQVAAALLTGIIGIVTGSSWTTAATIGVAFVGMANALGLSSAIAAGAVISGAYFGDLMTPLSETTILTPQIVGSNVYAHIRSLTKTTIPAYLATLAIFFLIGRGSDVIIPPNDTDVALQALAAAYNISLWNLLPVLVLLLLGIRKYPAFLSILIGTLVGALVAVLLQPQVVTAFANDASLNAWLASLKSVWMAMANGFTATTGVAEIDKLFSG